MKHKMEEKLFKLGFAMLQEKEDMIYFEKTEQPSQDVTSQTCIVYNKNTKKITSMDIYEIEETKMEIRNKNYSSKEIQNFVKSLVNL